MRRLIGLGLLPLGMLAASAGVSLARSEGKCVRNVCLYADAVNPHPSVRPRSIQLTADGTLEAYGISWSSWNGEVAIGHGTAEYHGCSPTCAQGKIHHAHVTIRVSQTVACDPTRHWPDGLYYNHIRLTKRDGETVQGRWLRSQNFAPCIGLL